jgi:hypothetical protein
MQIGKLGLQQQMVVVVARDIARAARTGAAGLHTVDHGLDHIGVLAHAQIVIRTPDGDFIHLAILVAGRARKRAAFALQLGKRAVVAF